MDTSEIGRVEKVRVMVLGTAVSQLVKNLIDGHLDAIAKDISEKDERITELEGEIGKTPDILHDVIATADGLMAENEVYKDKIARLEKVRELMAEAWANEDEKEFYMEVPMSLEDHFTQQADEIIAAERRRKNESHT